MTNPKKHRSQSATRASSRRRTPVQQAENHKHTRRARRQELVEDYVEVIADLIDEVGEARVVDIAARLGVSHVTVTKAVERLARDGLATTRPYRSIFLTETGRELAERIRRRHQIVVRFLIAIGVSDTTAQADAEGIEHHVSEETLAVFERIANSAGLPPTP